MTSELIKLIPVIPSQDIERDTAWYEKHAGFETFYADKMYAVIYREQLVLHLQWHADHDDDPLLGGSVVRIHVKHIRPIFDEFVERGTVKPDALKLRTAWDTNEFGFYDLNRNAIFVMEDVE
ncbi:MAG TPA: glyoxalase/bleomycin resistance/extradiol dioxygenase family protein [Blastocatellia bacterium]|nr:glyoxalase/bleomycin resistance/extradiol dioxygenase family protein [Blastocatellia bacterium]